MKYFDGSRSKQYALISVPLIALVVVVSVFTRSDHAPKSSSPLPSASASPSPSASTFASPLSDYPLSRFSVGRPTNVTGLRLVSSDGVGETISLAWNPNSSSENVDEYAIFYNTDIYDFPSGDREGIFAAVVKTPEITSKIVRVEDGGPQGYKPYGVNEFPICLADSGCAGQDQIQLWVIAHNKNGWGDNDTDTPDPDENPSNFSALSENQMKRVRTPQILTIGISDLDPKFASANWPFAPIDSDIQSLSNTSPPANQWTVPWLPEVDLPVSRFGPGRPSPVTNLKLSALDIKNKSISLTWDGSPTSEKVDKYAIYVNGSDCPLDFCGPTLLAVQSNPGFRAKLDFKGVSILNIADDGPGALVVRQGAGYSFFVLAHNSNGWGNNFDHVPNPDQKWADFRDVTPNEEVDQSLLPTELSVSIPSKP